MRGNGGVFGVFGVSFSVVENCMFLFGWPITLLSFVNSSSTLCQDTQTSFL